MTTLERDVARSVALAVKSVTAPLLARIAVLEGQASHSRDHAPDIEATVIKATAPLLSKIAELESRPVVVARDGRDGKDADMTVVAELRAELAAVRAELLAVKSWPVPKDGVNGTSVTIADVAPLIAAEVTKAVGAMPTPQNGKDGQSVTADDVRPLIQAEVAKIPIPKNGEHGKDGRSVTLDDVAPLVAASVAKAFEAMPKPKDGLGIKSAVVDNGGRLLLTLSNDEVKDLGEVVGRPGRDGLPAIGRPGADGTSVTLDDVRPMIHNEITRAVAAIPKPKDGRNGVDGKDGLGFEDLSVVFDEQKGVQLVFQRGAQKQTYDLPVPFYAGLWTAGRLYPKGANVTVKGAIYVALEPTRTRPEDGTPESAKAWRLAVKGGRDGKNGTNGRDGKDWNDV